MDRVPAFANTVLNSDSMNDFEKLNQILWHLTMEPSGDYILDYCSSRFGGHWTIYFDLVAQLLLDGYAQSDPGDLQFMHLTQEGEEFIRQGGYPVPLRQRARE
jgi:hypothetical protein